MGVNVPQFAASFNLVPFSSVLKGSKGYAFLRGNTGTEFEVMNVTFQYEIFQDSGTNGFIEQFTARGPLAEPIRVEVSFP